MRRIRADAGFTLIEALIAAALLAGALVTITQLVALATRATGTARDHAAVAMLASQRLEELLELPFDALQATPRGSDRVDRLYVRHWLVQPLPDDPVNAVAVQVLAARVAMGESAAREAAIVANGVKLVALKVRAAP